MYSPRIDETLIPDLYRLARARGVPMTRIVNDLVAREVSSPWAREEIARAGIPPKVRPAGRRNAA